MNYFTIGLQILRLVLPLIQAHSSGKALEAETAVGNAANLLGALTSGAAPAV